MNGSVFVGRSSERSDSKLKPRFSRLALQRRRRRDDDKLMDEGVIEIRCPSRALNRLRRVH